MIKTDFVSLTTSTTKLNHTNTTWAGSLTVHDLWRPLVFAGHLCGEVVLDEAVRLAPDHVVSQSQSFHALNANLKDMLHW